MNLTDKEINRLVHVHVFGNASAWSVPPYCQSAMYWSRVLERMESREYLWSVDNFRDGFMARMFGDAEPHVEEDEFVGTDPSSPGRAVCLAALRALGVEEVKEAHPEGCAVAVASEDGVERNEESPQADLLHDAAE